MSIGLAAGVAKAGVQVGLACRITELDALHSSNPTRMQGSPKVFVEGKLQTRKWQDQEGKDRYTTEVVAKEMTMLDSRSTSQAQENSPKVESDKPKDDFEEDIPF